MSQAQTNGDANRLTVVRRRRRERQIIVFGVAAIILGALAFAAAAVYRGEAEGPFSNAFHTPPGQFESDVTLVCPPGDTFPLKYEEVVVRVANGAGVTGLAGDIAETLKGRGFVVVGAMNASRGYGDHVRILYGTEGLIHAYTLATQFDTVDLVLDTREDITLDLILGEQFAADPRLRELLSPDLSEDLPLAARGECLPLNLVEAQPAPRTLPDNPLADPSPSASPEAKADTSDESTAEE